MRDSLKDKRIAVIGMARTGIATAEVLAALGAKVTLFDRKPADDLADELAEAARFGVKAVPGHPSADLTDTDLLVTSPGVPVTAPVFAEAKRLGVEVISEIELAYRISKAPILAITGTNGKTTTTVLLGRMMEADGRETYIGGNVAAGELKLPLVKAAYQSSENGVLVAEISTFQLEWISSFRPKVAALLNIGTDHYDRHTPEEYKALKRRIFEYQEQSDFSVVNADNQPSSDAANGLTSKVLRFSRVERVDEGAFVEDGIIKVRIDGKETDVCAVSDIKLRGTHNLENVLAASCMAVAFGASPEGIAEGVRRFGGVDHRMEHVAVVNGVEYINNSMCTNPEAFARSVEALGDGSIIIAGGKHKGGSLELVADAVKNHVRKLVLIGVSAPEIEAAVREAGFGDISRAETLEAAVEIAASMAQSGDSVMLAPACASFDMFNGFEHRGDVFKGAVMRLDGRMEH